MTCKECDRFCRFPHNPEYGLCAEGVSTIIDEVSQHNIIVSENTVCPYRFAYPQNGIVENHKSGAECKPIIYCKDCKWWKDSDGVYRRGIEAESKCPINRKEVFEGNGYCYMYEPKENEEE